MTERTHTAINILVAVAILVGAAVVTGAPSRSRSTGSGSPAVDAR